MTDCFSSSYFSEFSRISTMNTDYLVVFFIKEYFEKTFLSSVTRFRSENYTSIVSKQTRTMLAKRDCLEPTGVSPSAALREGDGKPISEVGSSEDRSY